MCCFTPFHALPVRGRGAAERLYRRFRGNKSFLKAIYIFYGVVLDERTQILNSEDRYSILEISQQNFGVEVVHVKEVLPLPHITPLPNVHQSVLGVFNLRGQIYSLLDLRLFFRLGRPPLNENQFVVVLQHQNIQFGVLVDKVLDVLLLDADKILIPTRDMASQYIQYINGYYEHKKLGIIYILDLGAIIEAKEIRQYRF